jgi:hypothetical protein
MWATLLALSLSVAQAQDVAVQELTAVDAQLVLKVKTPQDAADALVETARSLGGFFSSRTQQQVSFKIPTAQAEAFIAAVEASGLVVDHTFSNSGLTTEIADAEARVAAREEVLVRYFEVLEEAGTDAIVTVERTIVDLIAELESLKGRIRAMRYRAEYATITVRFQFRSRAAPVQDGSSSFYWLNTMNLTNMLGDFEYGASPRGTRRYREGIVADGFAPYTMRREARAVSPDNVLLRVRAEKHRPEADLAFWQEALLERMVAAGYRQAGDPEPITVDGVQGALVTFNAPVGVDDYAYMVGIFPDGKRLYIVEAAGEISRFEPRREAIEAAVSGLRF